MTNDHGQPREPFSWQPSAAPPAGAQPPEPAPYVPMQYFAPPPPPPAPPRRRRRGGLVVSLILLAAIGAGTYGVVANRQALIDQWTVWNHEPNSTVQAYIERAQLSDHGEFLLLASTPEIANGDEFNAVCGNQEEGSGVLGCYTSRDKKVTLFDVTDPQLDGIEEVVASHEMLHAAWDRLSKDRRAELTALLEKQYALLEGDAAFVERMEIYARTEPGQRANELHSIIGTEIGDLLPELEQYYAQYFDDRSVVVQLHVTSNAVFVEIEAKSAALIAELDALRTGIETDSTSANAQQAELNSDIGAFNAKADSGGFTTQEEFDRARASLVSRQAAINARFTDIESRIALFDSKSEELKQLNAQAAALNTALNITPRPSETIEP